MSKHLIDQGHAKESGSRTKAYSRLDRIRAGEAGHPKVQMLTRRSRKGSMDATRVKQFLRIERGYLA